MALALHAHWLNHTLYLWAESAAPPRWGALPASELRATLGDLFSDSLLASVAVQTQLELWLPCDSSGPIPSLFVAEPSAPPTAATLQAVRVPALAFSASQAMDLLAGLPEALPAIDAQAPRVADSLAYWAILAAFAADLMARRQFVPQLESRDDAAE
jgi:hypothetical protein